MATDLKRSAKKLASKGRYGDKFLLHVNRPEMMALLASGKITKNPKTGLPEAFNLGDFMPGGSKDPIFGGHSSNFLVGLANPFSDVSRDLNIGFGPLLNAREAFETGNWSNPFSAENTGWDVLAGGTMSEDPELRRIGRTVGTMFAAGALGNWAAGAGEAGAGAGAGGGYSMPAATAELGYANAVPGGVTAASGMGNAVTAGAAGTSGAALGGGTTMMPPAVAEDPAALQAMEMSETSPGVWELDGGGMGLSSGGFDEAGFSNADFGTPQTFENNLSAELSAGAPADPSYYQQLLDWLKQRGWKANLRTGMGLYNSIDGYMQAKAMEKLAKRADPMAAYRPGYAAEMAALQADPSRLNRTPGYQAGEQAVMRRMASQGYIGSGNMMRALQDYGTNAYDKEISRLSGLVNSPGAMQAAQMQEAASQQRSRALASLGFTAAGMF